MDRGELRAGFRDSMPVLLGVIPFGIACGIMGVGAGLSKAETTLMSMLVFAGSAQFVSINMLSQGISGLGLIWFTTLLINLRHMLMGASLAPMVRNVPLRVQALLAFGMVDEAYALSISRAGVRGYSLAYQFGASAGFYLGWTVSTVVGVTLGSYVSDPLSWGLDFAMPATFLALLVPRLTNKISLAVFAVAAITALLGSVYLAGNWYILLAAIAGCLLGGILEGGVKDEQ